MVGQSKTATTFQVLKQFHLLIFESKTSVYEFYCSLAHKTNSMATYLVINHYITFLRMVRQWRHISILKRMGWGHDPLGVSATSQGKYSHLPCLSSTRREPPHQLEDHTQRTKVSLHYPSWCGILSFVSGLTAFSLALMPTSCSSARMCQKKAQTQAWVRAGATLSKKGTTSNTWASTLTSPSR